MLELALIRDDGSINNVVTTYHSLEDSAKLHPEFRVVPLKDVPEAERRRHELCDRQQP